MSSNLDHNKISFSFIKTASIETKGNPNGFANAVAIWINKPHVLKRNLCGAKLLLYRLIEKEDVEDFTEKLVKEVKKSIEFEPTKFTSCHEIEDNGDTDSALCEVENLADVSDTQVAVVVRDVLPKQIDKHHSVREIIIYDHFKRKLTVLPLINIQTGTAKDTNISPTNSEEVSYQLTYVQTDQNSRIELEVQKEGSTEDKYLATCDWLKNYLLPKISSWSCESQLKTSVTSLRLVPIDQYNKLYSHLKEKYGKKFVEIWPESTDPKKFVYEDVAIATYLLLLWQQERKEKNLERKQSFVDLGCGNGLLVHILSSEGHAGVGLDVRKRNIWDLFGEGTCLKEETITPSAENTFPEYDWLIGNHSDELTPWIPVMAARSSYNCCYFVLPCCHYDFDKKFNKKQSGTSNYRSYLNFVQEVGQICGFNVEEDTLRIPSTKRVCFVGKTRSYLSANESTIDSQRSAYIIQRCGKQSETASCSETHVNSDTNQRESSTDELASKRIKIDHSMSDQWTSTFKPRDSTERTRNCQNIEKELKDFIVRTVFNHVFEADKEEVRELPNGEKWRKGGCVSLSEVVKLFEKETLKELKSECGGLQTLLRNHNSVFNGGNVQLRDLTLDDPWSGRSKLKNKDRSEYFKTIRCWFYDNHPDGCPRTSETCTFAHGEKDLKHIKPCDQPS